MLPVGANDTGIDNETSRSIPVFPLDYQMPLIESPKTSAVLTPRRSIRPERLDDCVRWLYERPLRHALGFYRLIFLLD